MLCQRCLKNSAAIRYAEVIDGQVTQMHLCKRCLAEVQEGAGGGFELAGRNPTISRKQKVRMRRDPLQSLETCRSCGTDLDEVMYSGRVGCSICYDSFGEQLEGLLEELHTTAFHRGKVPRIDDNRARVRADLQSKRSLLRSALKVENYEEAATLRDEIRALEEGLGVSEMGVD